VQAAPGPAGWYAEVEGEQFLQPGNWLLDVDWLASTGWQTPDNETDNWWQVRIPNNQIARVLVDSLRHARSCLLADLASTQTGTFPSGPRGGEPLEPVNILQPRARAA
jgi:hypothetical protein